MEPITNRVAESEIEVLDLAKLVGEEPVVELDIAQFLVEGLVLREKDFRERVKRHDWPQYNGAHVALVCSTEAIVPTWAYMLIGTRLNGVAVSCSVGSAEDALRDRFVRVLERYDLSRFENRIVVVKGCGGHVPTNAYLDVTTRLQAAARKVMFGEPCSSVPLWRRREARGSVSEATLDSVRAAEPPHGADGE